MAKGNVCHYIGQTKPVDHPALWIRVEVNHIYRMIFRLKAAVFIVFKKLIQNEFIFIFLNWRETDIIFDLPGNSLCYTTKRCQAFIRRSCDTRKFVGTLAYKNRFWRAPVAKLEINIVHIQHIKTIRGRRCCCKHMLLDFHRTNFDSNWGKRTEVCWVRSDALHGSLQLFLDRDFGCPQRYVFRFFSSLLNVNCFSSTRKCFFGWDFTSLIKRSKSFQFKLKRRVTWERRALIRETSSFWGLWNKRFQNCALVDKSYTFLNCARGCTGFISKNVKVVAVWE